MTAPKKKKLTQREIRYRAEVKKELQEKGIIPPDKLRLNRKKFAKEVFDEYENNFGGINDMLYLLKQYVA